MSTLKNKAFMDGFFSFYTGKKQEITYTRCPGNITEKAWKMTGDSLRKAMRDYDGKRN